MNYKDIHIGELIKNLVAERGIDLPRICNFLNCKEKDVIDIYQSESLDCDLLLRWCKVLEYDFFRIYSQHLILFAPANVKSCENDKTTTVPQFRKNIYTKEIIEFILEKLDTDKMTKAEVIKVYNIPKTTLYKWINKYKK